MPETKTPPPLTDVELAAWRSRIEASVEPMKALVREGKENVSRYCGKMLEILPKDDTVVVPLDFVYLEQKKAQLLPQLPDLILTGKRPDAEASAPVATAVINHALSPEGVNADAMLFEILPDVLGATGFGVTKIGYENVVQGTKLVPSGRMIPDPNAVPQPGAVLGLGAAPPMVPEQVPVPNIISETYYWRRIPPGRLRVPAEFRGSNFDEAPWIGWRFEEDVPDGEQGSGGTNEEEFLLSDPPTTSQTRQPKRYGTEVWYRASRFDADPAARHPERIRTFTIYDDAQTTTPERKDSPFQRWNPDGSDFLGMRGYPIHTLTLRYTPDRWAPRSDVAMSRQQGDEISKGRSQMIRRRDRALPQVGYDATRVLPDQLAKIEKGENTGMIGFNGPVDGAFSEINKGQFGRENFTFDQIVKADYDQIWALGANAGVLRTGSETATKTADVRASVDTRLESERARVIRFLVSGAMKLFSLYQLFADTDDYVRIAGPQSDALVKWNKQGIPGPYAFKARPNSHIRLDAQADFQQELDFFNLAGNAPEGNRAYMLSRLAEKRGLDPARALQPPPPKTPDPGKLAISIKMEDFVGPQAPITVEIAQQMGLKISPTAIQQSQAFMQQQLQLAAQANVAQGGPGAAPQTEHGGAMLGGGEVAPINQHMLDRTGGMQGLGGGTPSGVQR